MKTSSTHKGNTMQIQLTQDEIKEAVRHYVTDSLGINLAGKTLTTTFTATRGEAGIVATLVLQKTGDAEAAEIPGFTNASDAEIAQANTAPVINSAADVTTEAKVASKAAKATPEKGAVAPVTAATLAPAAEVATAAATTTTEAQAAPAEAVAEAAVEGEAPKTTTSLFG